VLRLPLSMLSPAGPRARLSILIFHRVLREADPLFPEEPDASRFEVQMRWVRQWFNVLPLAQAIDMLYTGTLPARAMAITFDDGYADNVEVAAPILHRLGLTAIFFITTGFADGGCMWNDRLIEAIRHCPNDEMDLSPMGLQRFALRSLADRRHAAVTLRRDIRHLEPARRQAITDAIVAATGGMPSPPLMMRPDQIRQLRTMNMGVGAHTETHPILTRIGSDAARNEIRRSKAWLEQLLDEAVDLFAYPNGVPREDYTAEHVEMVRACGFSAAVATAWGAASPQSDRFQLPRFTPWDSTRLRFGARLLANLNRAESLIA
jgi:peptidoglycan/xylan/chitin deacetylase (PgdA/CDA1 family)